MSLLVYVGAHTGNGLVQYLDQYDEIIVFEPMPEAFNALVNRFHEREKTMFVNAACSDQEGEMDLFIPPHAEAASLSEISDFSVENGFSGGQYSNRRTTVPVVNLNNFLKHYNVDHIDLLITDCQGSDLTILKTMQEWIDNRKIDNIICETHDDGVELYAGLNNQYGEFRALLSENYEVKDYYFNGQLVSKEQPPYAEWDIHWTLK